MLHESRHAYATRHMRRSEDDLGCQSVLLSLWRPQCLFCHLVCQASWLSEKSESWDCTCSGVHTLALGGGVPAGLSREPHTCWMSEGFYPSSVNVIQGVFVFTHPVES